MLFHKGFVGPTASVDPTQRVAIQSPTSDRSLPKPCKQHLDVGVIMDSSNNVKPTDYNITRRYLIQLAERLQISENGTHMAIHHYRIRQNLYFSGIDGGYTEWSEWSNCSEPCGGGLRLHTRNCTNPVPRNNGKTCIEQNLGQAEESQGCNTQDCRKKTTIDLFPTVSILLNNKQSVKRGK